MHNYSFERFDITEDITEDWVSRLSQFLGQHRHEQETVINPALVNIDVSDFVLEN